MSDLNENISLPNIEFYRKGILDGDMEMLMGYLRTLEKMIKVRDWDTVMAINSKQDA